MYDHVILIAHYDSAHPAAQCKPGFAGEIGSFKQSQVRQPVDVTDSARRCNAKIKHGQTVNEKPVLSAFEIERPLAPAHADAEGKRFGLYSYPSRRDRNFLRDREGCSGQKQNG